MEHDDIVLEEGELCDSDDEYTPLERPTNYSKTQPLPRLPSNPVSESDEEERQSDSDSDSDPNTKKVKKPKIRLKPQPQQRSQIHKKFDIWSNRLQEDTLAATLDNCDVVQKDRSRDVESYDFTIAHKYYENKFKVIERTNNKRRHDDRNTNFRQIRRSTSSDRDIKGVAKIISDLKIDINGKPEDLARDIANKLFEEKEELILKAINILGKQKAIDIFNKVKDIEADGGMLIMNKTRRRTPGGVYLFLVRHDYHITPDQRNEIFGEERQNYKNLIKKKQKEKRLKLRQEIAKSREKMFPDLLTRAEMLASQNPTRKEKETDDQDFVNPPPTPETDGYENSRDGMEGSTPPVINSNDSLDTSRAELNTYDDDFLDLGCADDMDLF
ncbi:phosphorylated adapter RNA export protein [Diorhabda carinulata]|uniref:phosphorylated adapter RNA export protein n=1 Tax=Diorhabda carinulata TaxID=1163345 RepID=UPI0025A1C006|nr:phosphorylated adapter RNA export protein [Diorhabda carinulata]